MNRIHSLSSLLLAAALGVAALPAQGPATLRYKFTPGETQHFELANVMFMGVSFAGQKMDTDVRISMFLSLKVDAVKDGVATGVVTPFRLKMKMDSMMAKVDFDSDNEAAGNPGPMAEMLEVLDEKFAVTISETGKVTDVKVPESAEQHADDMKRTISQLFVELPAAATEVGKGWTTEVPLSMGKAVGADTVKVENKLTKVDGDKAEIDQVVNLDLATGESPMQKVEKATGKVVVDLKTGRLVESGMEIVASGTQEQGEVKVEMNMKLSMTAKPCEAPKPKEPKKEEPKKDEGKKEEPIKEGK